MGVNKSKEEKDKSLTVVWGEVGSLHVLRLSNFYRIRLFIRKGFFSTILTLNMVLFLQINVNPFDFASKTISSIFYPLKTWRSINES